MEFEAFCLDGDGWMESWCVVRVHVRVTVKCKKTWLLLTWWPSLLKALLYYPLDSFQISIEIVYCKFPIVFFLFFFFFFNFLIFSHSFLFYFLMGFQKACMPCCISPASRGSTLASIGTLSISTGNLQSVTNISAYLRDVLSSKALYHGP